LIPPFFLDCVVSIGYRRIVVKTAPDGKRIVNRGEFLPVASGFLYGDYLKKLDEKQNQYQVYLVTNKHVEERVERLEKEQIEQISPKLATSWRKNAILSSVF